VFGEVRWTEDSESHIARHGVSTTEVEDVLYSRPRLLHPGRDDTTMVFGRTTDGRYLVVVVSVSTDGLDFVVTARDMTDNERRAFRRRR
jgi:hypothetical protein